MQTSNVELIIRRPAGSAATPILGPRQEVGMVDERRYPRACAVLRADPKQVVVQLIAFGSVI